MPFELIVQDAMKSVRLSDGRPRDLDPGTHIHDEADMALLRGHRHVVQVWVDTPTEAPKIPEAEVAPDAPPADPTPEHPAADAAPQPADAAAH